VSSRGSLVLREVWRNNVKGHVDLRPVYVQNACVDYLVETANIHKRCGQSETKKHELEKKGIGHRAWMAVSIDLTKSIAIDESVHKGNRGEGTGSPFELGAAVQQSFCQATFLTGLLELRKQHASEHEHLRIRGTNVLTSFSSSFDKMIFPAPQV
jgi:hypothetical protein